MKLLLDQNISRRLVPELLPAFPGTAHVSQLGLETAADMEIWRYAAQHGFTIVSKDSDFRDLAHSRGGPPKVVHLDLGNCSSAEILTILLKQRTELEELDRGVESLLVILRD